MVPPSLQNKAHDSNNGSSLEPDSRSPAVLETLTAASMNLGVYCLHLQLLSEPAATLLPLHLSSLSIPPLLQDILLLTDE